MTQNPRVYEALRSLSPSGIAYPAPGIITYPDEIKEIAKSFCKVPGLNYESMKVSNVYSSVRKDKEFKRVKDSSIEKFFTENLGEDDGFFVVVPLR